MFHGSAAALTTTLMSCDKLYSFARFPWFNRINRVCRFDGFSRNLAKMFRSR